MLDVFFLSNNEPFADDNYSKLLTKIPHVKRVNGIKGFYQAHKRCAELSMTNNFYVVDSDAIILENFTFNFTPSKYNELWGKSESDIMYVWSSINPINDLVYGYGGVKLIPKIPLVNSNNIKTIDFTTGSGLTIKVLDQISNVTAFNYDPFGTWRAAFRECVKLSANLTNENLKLEVPQSEIDRIQEETKNRLDIWCTVGADRLHGQYAISGANCGKDFGIRNKDNIEVLENINDLEWMKNEFIKFFNE